MCKSIREVCAESLDQWRKKIMSNNLAKKVYIDSRSSSVF